jgi:RNA polymerase sigma-32 factor
MPTNDDTTLTMYLAEIGRYPLLDVASERALARQFIAGDRACGKQLVTSNLRFVVRVAREYRGYGLRLADLIQEGNLGLMRAVEKFDPEREIRLISYAVWWIRAYIQNYILHSWSLVKLGTTQTQRRLFFSLAKAKREIERMGLPDGERLELLARELQVDPSDVSDMELRMSGRDISLDVPVEVDGPSRVETVAANDVPADEVCAANEVSSILSQKVKTAMGRLDAREQFIIQHRVLDEAPVTFKELGEHFGVSRERARQIEIRAKHKLRRILQTDLEGLELQMAA